MHGSMGGRWKRGGPVGHLRVPGRCVNRINDDPVGTHPTDQPQPRQRSTLHGLAVRRAVVAEVDLAGCFGAT